MIRCICISWNQSNRGKYDDDKGTNAFYSFGFRKVNAALMVKAASDE